MSKETTSCDLAAAQELRIELAPGRLCVWTNRPGDSDPREYLRLHSGPDQQILRGDFGRKSPILLQIAFPAQILRA